ncbi:hypothetical protein [Limimaricola sp. AA108-03]|uniref:hypothetical protein n=1 Tax=Limimaricola sp. AA108-03 TaxID=3425945 RepID=UPI003D77ACE0
MADMISVLRLSLPLGLWLASFSAVYGLHGLLCSSRWAAPPIALSERALLIGATLAAIALQALCLLILRSPRWREPDPRLRNIGLALATVALLATAWTMLPVVAFSSCL